MAGKNALRDHRRGRKAFRRRPKSAPSSKLTKSPGVFAPSSEQLRRIAFACTEAAACYAVLAKRARCARLGGEAMELALRHRDSIAAVDALARARGLAAHRVSTCERLRWEWFASTAALLDGAPDVRLAREGVRVTREAASAARGLDSNLRGELDACLDAALGIEVRAVTPPRDAAFARR
jgi:hypothetical protein